MDSETHGIPQESGKGGRHDVRSLPASQSEWKASLYARASARWNAIVGQINHRRRFVYEHMRRADVAILGSYHGANLGDTALGLSLQNLVKKQGLSVGLHTIYSANKWPKCRYAIIGGGTISYMSAFRELTRTYGDCPERVAIVGVDFRDPEAIAEYRPFLQKVAYISCRSSAQAAKMSGLLGRSDISWHFDACFAAPWFESNLVSKNESAHDGAKVIGVNIPPLFLTYENGRFVVGSMFANEIKRKAPHIYERMDEYAHLYVKFARQMCGILLKQGYEVVHLPFAVEDEFFSRTFLHPLGVRCDSFSRNPASIARSLGSMKSFVPFRYHATVFGLCARVPIYPFCYASKCEELLSDLDIGEALRINPEFLNREAAAEEFLAKWGSGLRLDEEHLSKIQADARDSISGIITRLVA